MATSRGVDIIDIFGCRFDIIDVFLIEVVVHFRKGEGIFFENCKGTMCTVCDC